MKNIFLYLIFLFFSLTVNAQHLSKVYILSEGGFSPGSAALSMLDVQNNQFSLNIFFPGNLGLFPDGLVLHNDNLYLTEQGNFSASGRIYKLDTLGNVLSSAIVGTNPYSLTISNNKIYITNGPASNVSVLNLSNFSLIKTISVGVYPQEIISFNNRVFVANNSRFGGNADSTISVIDANTDSLIHTIIVRKDPSSLAISNDNHLLVGCPGNANVGRIFKINPDNFQIIDTFLIPVYGFGKDISVDKNSNKIYFIANTNDIVEYDLNTRTANLILASQAQNNFYYGYGFDFLHRRHYVLDAKNFAVNGTLSVLSSTGSLINSYTTRIAPRRVAFEYTTPSSTVSDSFIADGFELFQNYPNPFNPNTNISWKTDIGAHNTLKIYDVLGNEVAVLVDQWKEAGRFSIEFDGSKLSSGIYFYNLTISDGNSTKNSIKKMTLLK